MKIHKNIDPRKLRERAYKSTGDQLDLIIKTFDHLRKQGIDVGPAAIELIDHAADVKGKYKKQPVSQLSATTGRQKKV
ncbi:hypothetical protein [Bowmanella sp. JS7-9]|uniref:Uncharacterized protein n=1 Tax=Pseudobowmanella zhangzhouensis TaxID=1537679 RepID=A0ABW1XQQ8_9ALTE|nr:hypothetical protein [Bowmanella sp. JS7-9]TBX21934.1 hypothetical protein TK45_10630 [Bowmanella sp. JS7-9]